MSKDLPALTGVRFLAALTVVLAHGTLVSQPAV
jgi:peptidoglycan/LPS O-acetylase OafA/YrhL